MNADRAGPASALAANRDLGHKNADAEQFKAILAAEIIKALEREGLSGARRMAVRELRLPTSRASATQILEDSPLIGLCPSSTGSAHGWKSKSVSGAQSP